MFYQVATGRPPQMFKKNNLGGILRIQVLYLCSAKIEESLDIHLVYHSGQWFLVNKQISYSDWCQSESSAVGKFNVRILPGIPEMITMA